MGNREMLNVQGSVFLLASRKFTASLNTKVSIKNTILKGSVAMSNPRFMMKTSCCFIWLCGSLSKDAAEKRLPGDVRSCHADFAAVCLKFDGIHDAA